MSITFTIGLNGVVSVVSVERGGREVVGEGIRKKVGGVLGLAEDVGVVVAWLGGVGDRGGG